MNEVGYENPFNEKTTKISSLNSREKKLLKESMNENFELMNSLAQK